MFDTLMHSKEDAIAILKKDHETVKELFKKFEDAEDLGSKKRIAAEAIMELKLHAEIEEKIFYPTVRKEVGKDIMNEADEEHHVAKLLIAELEQMDGTEERWEAKFIVLAENIRHHIKEEEGEMLPKARSTDTNMEILGRKLMVTKQQLKKDGVPPSAEDKLMARAGKSADSPAKNAQLKKPAKPVKSPKVKVKATPAKRSKKA